MVNVLDHETRLYVRQQIAERKRIKLFEYEVEACGGTCAGCGTPWSLPSPGCTPCNDRESRRRRRGSPPRGSNP